MKTNNQLNKMKKTNKILISAFMLGIIIIATLYLASASSLIIKDASTSPSQVSPGSKFQVSVTLENNLNQDLEFVTVNLNLLNTKFSPVSTSQEVIDELPEDKSKTVYFELMANPDAAGGSYQIPVIVSYSLTNSTQQISTFIAVLVNSKPEFNLDSDSVLIQNQKTNLDIKVTNIGLTGAKFLEVELGSGSYNLLSSGRVYIGNLNSDDFDTASYTINVKNSGMISFPLTLTYRDSANKEYTENKVITIKVYSQQEAINLGLTAKSNAGLYIGIVILVIVAYIIYRIIRGILKRRKNNKEM